MCVYVCIYAEDQIKCFCDGTYSYKYADIHAYVHDPCIHIHTGCGPGEKVRKWYLLPQKYTHIRVYSYIHVYTCTQAEDWVKEFGNGTYSDKYIHIYVCVYIELCIRIHAG